MKFILKKCLLIFLFFAVKMFSQTNEIGITTSITRIGVNYENFTRNHFSFGGSVGTGLFSLKKDQVEIMSDFDIETKDHTKVYFAPFVRYYFADNDFSRFFLMAEYLYNPAERTVYRDGKATEKHNITFHGPMVGGGYKFLSNSKLSVYVFFTIGYDLNDNDLTPVLADGIVSVGYRF